MSHAIANDVILRFSQTIDYVESTLIIFNNEKLLF